MELDSCSVVAQEGKCILVQIQNYELCFKISIKIVL
jgi:hypothetical protein